MLHVEECQRHNPSYLRALSHCQMGFPPLRLETDVSLENHSKIQGTRHKELRFLILFRMVLFGENEKQQLVPERRRGESQRTVGWRAEKVWQKSSNLVQDESSYRQKKCHFLCVCVWGEATLQAQCSHVSP